MMVCEEFSAQVAREKAEGLPFAPHMDGLTSPQAVAKLQVGFVDYVVAPLWNALANIMPEFKELTGHMAANRGTWKAIADGSVQPPGTETVPGGGGPGGGGGGGSGGAGGASSAVPETAAAAAAAAPAC
jgi:hypothetical protein